jgi:polyphosphate kinase
MLMDRHSCSILQDIIEACLCDRVGAWEMQPDGRYQLLGVGKGAEIPRAVIPDPGNRLAPRAEHIGFQGALMELAQRQSRKAKKVDFKKKDGRVQRPRRYEVFEEH